MSNLHPSSHGKSPNLSSSRLKQRPVSRVSVPCWSLVQFNLSHHLARVAVFPSFICSWAVLRLLPGAWIWSPPQISVPQLLRSHGYGERTRELTGPVQSPHERKLFFCLFASPGIRLLQVWGRTRSFFKITSQLPMLFQASEGPWPIDPFPKLDWQASVVKHPYYSPNPILTSIMHVLPPSLSFYSFSQWSSGTNGCSLETVWNYNFLVKQAGSCPSVDHA